MFMDINEKIGQYIWFPITFKGNLCKISTVDLNCYCKLDFVLDLFQCDEFSLNSTIKGERKLRTKRQLQQTFKIWLINATK